MRASRLLLRFYSFTNFCRQGIGAEQFESDAPATVWCPEMRGAELITEYDANFEADNPLEIDSHLSLEKIEKSFGADHPLLHHEDAHLPLEKQQL